MGGQFAPEKRWSVCSGKQPKSNRFIGGQFAPESGGQFDRILHYGKEKTKRSFILTNHPLVIYLLWL